MHGNIRCHPIVIIVLIWTYGIKTMRLLRTRHIASALRKLGVLDRVHSFVGRLGGAPAEIDASKVWSELGSALPDNGRSCVVVRDGGMAVDCDLHIIVPVYNVAEFLEECIESILSQVTRFSFKVTFINDGSTDRSAEILERYRHDPHVEIVTQENRGFSGARNAGLDRMSGRYVMFVDSDDILLPGAIEHLMDTASRSGADIVQGGFRFFSTKGVHGDFLYPDGALEGQLSGFAWAKVYRREVFARIEFPENYWFEDTVISMIVPHLAQSVVCTSHVVYGYRVRKKSITSTSRHSVKVLDSLYVTRCMLRDMVRLGISPDIDDYERFLMQVKVNNQRLDSHGDRRLTRLAFYANCVLLDEFFGGFTTADPRLQRLETAMRRRRLNQFELAVGLLK